MRRLKALAKIATAASNSDLLVWRLAAGGALIAAWLFLIPFSPVMPGVGLDPSWKYALNEAVARGSVFGRDVIFSFGPLASVYTQVYSPATDTLMLIGSAIYAAGICTMLGLAACPKPRFLALAVPVLVALSMEPDTLFMVLPFALLLTIVRLGLPPASPQHLQPGPAVLLAVAVATIAVGMEPMIKGSFIGVAFALSFVAFVVLLLHKWRFAFVFVALLGVSLVGAWALTGQPLRALPDFFATQVPVIAGYTEAMSIGGARLTPLLFLGASAVILAGAHRLFAKEPAVARWSICGGLAWTLFVGFKAGFVRQDNHHTFISAALLLVLGYLLCTASARTFSGAVAARAVPVRTVNAWMASSACLILLIDVSFAVGIGQLAQWVVPGAHQQIRQPPLLALDGLVARILHPQALAHRYARSVAAIKAQEPLPRVAGTVDVYPTELSAVFANNLRWSGRPVFQSYTAYAPELQAANVAHLSGPAAPDTVFFAFAPIDRHLPASEDSRSLLRLLATYRITAWATPYVRMDRAPGSRNAQLRPAKERSTAAEWDRDIAVADGPAMWVSVDARPTLLGRLLGSAFKLPELEIDLTLADGSVVAHRFIASVGRSGFIVSPYLRTAADLVDLAAGTRSPCRVTSFKLVTHSPTLWEPNVAVRLTPISITPQPAAKAMAVAAVREAGNGPADVLPRPCARPAD